MSGAAGADTEGHLHPPLVEALRAAPRVTLHAGHPIFHGCLDTDQDIDVAGRKLNGGRKWTSENPVYAADYGFRMGSHGRPLFWQCRLAVEVIAIVASQSELHRCGPWFEPYTAPWMFPSGFAVHAYAALGSEAPVVLADFERDGCFQEILVPDPARLLQVEDVRVLPVARDEARHLVRQLFG